MNICRCQPGSRDRLHQVAFMLGVVTVGLVGFAQEPVAVFGVRDRQVGQFDSPLISESSGVVASRKQVGVFWTHNDSGNAPQIFAVSRTGEMKGTFSVDALNADWEDIATDDEGHLYLADIGNNLRWRTELSIYQLDEPDVLTPAAPTTQPGNPLKVKRTWKVVFPKNVEPFDAESFFVWRGQGYVVSKVFKRAQATLYRFPLDESDGPKQMEAVTPLPIYVPCTGADLSVDGTQMVIVTREGPSLFHLTEAGRFDGLSDAPFRRATGTDHTTEAVCFAPAQADAPAGVLGTAESGKVFFFPFDAFRKASNP